MTRKEFETRIGREATQEEYAYADAIYLSAPNIDKDIFCKEYKGFKDSQTVKDMVERIAQMNKRIERMEEERREIFDMLITENRMTDRETLRRHAIKMEGEKEYLRRKIELGLEYDEMDYGMLKRMLEYI